MERKLVAILAADVVGYSRLMNEDEAGTLATLRSRQKTLIDPRVAEHGGRVVKLMGDGVLAEFASIVHAVECAVELQRGIAASNAKLPADRRMRLRIGVNLGDVMVEDGDIYGDGVNIATRLEQLAEPGGICISAGAYEQVKHRLRLDWRDMGELKVKNIADPMRVFQVDPMAGEDRPDDAEEDDGDRADQARPSIVVLPFDNLGNDEEQDVLCDGLTSDITTDLSKFSSIFVIASNTAFTYKKRPTRVEEVARALNVRYVLEGSVQQMGERIRINAQLIDAVGGHHLWAQRYDRETSDLFALQDEMLRRIVTALAVRLTAVEHERASRKHPASVNAYEAYLRGMHLYTTRSAEELATSRAWFERAVALDPHYARAWGALAYALVQEWLNGWRDDSALELAEGYAHKSVALDPNDYMPHSFLAFCCLNARYFDIAITEYERAYELNPNDADLLADMSEALVYVGRHGEALERIERAVALNPHTPDWYRWDVAWARSFLKDYEKALTAAPAARRAPDAGGGPGAARQDQGGGRRDETLPRRPARLDRRERAPVRALPQGGGRSPLAGRRAPCRPAGERRGGGPGGQGPCVRPAAFCRSTMKGDPWHR
jgi:adenylate cyclase